MTLTKWNPIAELQEMRNKMDQWLEKSSQLVQAEDASDRFWQPLAEVSANENELVIEMDLPGVNQEDIQVRIEEHTLMISGVRKRLVGEGFIGQRCERTYGLFSREFALSDDIDESRTLASCELGVLQVRLVKKCKGVPLRIDVEVK